MLITIFYLTILFHSLISLTTSTPTQFPPKDDGFTASLIPPLSPRSPFYPQILAANNFSTTLPNITLNLTHYDKWFYTNGPISQNTSRNDYAPVKFKQWVFTWAMELSLGEPAQLVYGIFDTGSPVTWFQCEARAGIGQIGYYNQSMSKTYRVTSCRDQLRCNTHIGMGCNEDGLCEYGFRYVEGFSKGVMSTDVFKLKPSLKVTQNFEFGCSNDNPINLPGIIGASNSEFGMPRQVYPSNPKFSYCYSGNSDKISFIQFGASTQLLGQPVKMYKHQVETFFYIDVIGIQVNGEDLNVPPSEFKMSIDGLTGFIIDSGYTVTSLSSVAFDALKSKVVSLLGPPTFYQDFEICYPFNTFGRFWPYKSRPKISIKFGNLVFDIDEINLWFKMWLSKLECLRVLRARNNNLSVLGNEQLSNVNVGYDPKNNLIYLQHMECPYA